MSARFSRSIPMFVAGLVVGMQPRGGSPGKTLQSGGQVKTRRLLPFPTTGPRWSIRGKVRANALLQEPWKQDRVLLTLPDVVVWVDRADKQWKFEPPRRTVLSIPRGARRHVDVMMAGGQVFWKGKATHCAGDCIVHVDRQGCFVPRATEVRLRIEGVKTDVELHFLRHTLFALTDKDGRFVLPKIPKGKYQVMAKHKLLGTVTRSVIVRGGRQRPTTLEFDVSERVRIKDTLQRLETIGRVLDSFKKKRKCLPRSVREFRSYGDRILGGPFEPVKVPLKDGFGKSIMLFDCSRESSETVPFAVAAAGGLDRYFVLRADGSSVRMTKDAFVELRLPPRLPVGIR